MQKTRAAGECFLHFLECSQMTGVFCHSVIHGLGFFICFNIQILLAQNNKTRFFYVLYSDKTWVFDQSERAQGPIYILIIVILAFAGYVKTLRACRAENGGD